MGRLSAYRHELEEADDLCHGNWIEIDYIDKLKAILEKNDTDYSEN